MPLTVIETKILRTGLNKKRSKKLKIKINNIKQIKYYAYYKNEYYANKYSEKKLKN